MRGYENGLILALMEFGDWIFGAGSRLRKARLERPRSPCQEYVKKVGGGMAKTYQVKPETGIGKEGVAVRQNEAADSRMLTLIGHRGNEVIMTQMSFHGGVDAQQQAEAIKLTVEMFGRDTGGGLVLPSR